MKLRVTPAVLALCVFAYAQQPKPQPKGSNSSQSSLGTVRDNRNATIPANPEAVGSSQNELVGCVSQQGNKFVLMQPRERRWYELRGDQAQLQNNVGKIVKVSGQLILGQKSAFNVRQLQTVQDKCEYESSSTPLPATGKAGVQGKAETVTSTATVEQATPGVQTQRGVSQDPGKGGHNPGHVAHPTASQAAPPNPNIENPDEAQRIANAAQQSELSNQSQLGVTAQPNYSNANSPQANAQAVANTAQQERGQASGSQQVFKGGEKQAPGGKNAQGNQNSGGTPILTGCLSHDGAQYWLAQQSGSRVRLVGDEANLKEHVDHTVQVVAKNTNGETASVSAGGESAVQVRAIQDVAPTCQKQ